MLFTRKKEPFYARKKTITLDGRLIEIDHPMVMGILNVTSDSFYDGGKYVSNKAILKRSEKILEEGGEIIDIGAYSTRPGARDIPVLEEVDKLKSAVRMVRKEFPDAIISIDTFRASVARDIVNETGPCIINDISGGTMDDKMFETVAELGVPYIMMHIQGTPKTMQQNPHYNDVVQEILMFFAERVQQLKLLGVKDVILDPGFGFGKSVDHNFELMNRLDSFGLFQFPLLVGVSRKSMIWKLLGTTAAESLTGTTTLNTVALMGGADILRVHDVKEAVETIKIYSKLKSMVK